LLPVISTRSPGRTIPVKSTFTSVKTVTSFSASSAGISFQTR
jgi:hypothetical protein